MKTPDIRVRMLLAALLPVSLLVILLSGAFLASRFDDIDESYQARTRSVARQLAMASEFGLFAANEMHLQAIARGALREPEVRWVAILDRQGRMLASAGDTRFGSLPTLSASQERMPDEGGTLDVLTQPVLASGLELDDVYEHPAGPSQAQVAPLGRVVLKFSRQQVDQKKRDMLYLAGSIVVLGLLFGAVLAVRLSRGVIRPILRITQLIERIGRGDFAAVSEEPSPSAGPKDPLLGLQLTLRSMAERLGDVQEELARQVTLATRELRQKKDEAELATLAKSRFLAAASHDLRQPIHALGMFVARLAQLSHDAPTRALIGHLEASVRALQNLLDGLFDLSRLESGTVKIKQQAFALNELFQRLDQDLAATALDKGLRLRIRPCALGVQSDPVLLYRILLNLVGNALRYTERGGVLVACRPGADPAHVSIEVWDSGVGIAPEHQQAVFKEFYQVDNPARQRAKGMGLGLSIVQQSCQLLNHPLQLSSRLGVGTRIRLTLPQATPDTPRVEVFLSDAGQDADEPGAAVLVIDDDDLVRTALVELLHSWGYRVHHAAGLDEARQVLQRGFVPAIIINDYRLDGSSQGIDVIAQLRQQLASPVPACLISGDADPALLVAARVAQLTLLHKPVRPAKLRSLLRRLLVLQPVRDEA